MKAKVTEVFRSIQGEGKYAGVPQVFVRFWGCNMRCAWCDTPTSNTGFKEYTLDALSQEVISRGALCHSVSLTGGEPLMQIDFIKEFLMRLKKASLKTYLETNGILYHELSTVIDAVDIIAMDIKLPSSTKQKAYWFEHEQFLQRALKADIFVKTVVSSETVASDVITCAQIISRVAPQICLVLQPNYFDLDQDCLLKCQEFQKISSQYLSDVRVLGQLHKQLQVR